MQNEILRPVLATDETAIPRYDIVNPDGSVAQQNVELRLKNEVMQQGTPYDEESVLPTALLNELGLSTSATPAQAFQAMLTKFSNIFTKSETLSDTTKSLFGLGSDAVPDDALAMLSRFNNGLGNEYVWEKSTVTESLDLGTSSTETNTSTGAAVSGGWFIYSDDPVKVYKGTGDKITSSSSSSKTNIQNAIRGKYFRTDGMASNYIAFAPTSATLSVSSSYWNINSVTNYCNVTFTVTKTVNGYANSPDPNAYPPAVSDGYTYTPLGKFGKKVQIDTGTYEGTGNNNSVVLTFSGTPSLVIIANYNTNTKTGSNYFWIIVNGVKQVSLISASNTTNCEWSGNTLTLTNTSNGRINEQGNSYMYHAFII